MCLLSCALAFGLVVSSPRSASARKARPAAESQLADRNKATFRAYLQVWQNGDVDKLGSIIAPGYVGHASTGDRDLAGLIERIGVFRRLYPDVKFEILDQVAEGDRVATRMRATATSSASGQRVVLFGLNISRFVDGRVVEEWPVWETTAAP
jgi:predicted ester cyclase